MKLFLRILTLIVVTCSAQVGFCIETPKVLPKKIRVGFISIGQYYGLNQYYSDDGELKHLADKNSFELDSRSLVQVNSAFSDLVRVLNEFGHSSLGSQLHLGQIKVNADPQIRYYAPTLAYGLTKKLTVGAALPFISYNNKIRVVQTGSNIDYARSQVGSHVPEINAAFTQLDNELKKGINGTLAEKGYKGLDSKDETYLGDAMLFSAYMFDAQPNHDWKRSLRLYLNLPTGPKADPDDLTDLETFGRYSLRAQLLGEKNLAKQLSLIVEGSYLLVPEQNQTKRVPLNAEDVLPDQRQKFDLKEDLGDTVGGSAGLAYVYNTEWSFMSTYGYQYKFKDTFGGAPNGRGRFLEEGTNRSAQIARAQVSYSSVQAYLSKKADLPGSIDYEIAKTMAGTNVENQTIHSLTLSLFF
jgi:hypothetical protein